MRLLIFGRHTDNTDYAALARFFDYLIEEQVFYAVDPAYGADLQENLEGWDQLIAPFLHPDDANMTGFNFALSFGGDGTFLNSARRIGESGIPLLGVNFGRLGFLTSIMQDQLFTAIDELRRDMYRVETRVGIHVESHPEGLFHGHNLGLNDLTIHKTHSNEMITVHTFVNGEFLNSYWGDGLIIATPTGSTAYSMACGGPIIHPQSNVFVITPVAPHSLTVRPMVIPNDNVVSFEIESRSGQAMIALDTHSSVVNSNTEIAVRKADYGIKLVRVGGANYLQTLRTRLMWGRDSRN